MYVCAFQLEGCTTTATVKIKGRDGRLCANCARKAVKIDTAVRLLRLRQGQLPRRGK